VIIMALFIEGRAKYVCHACAAAYRQRSSSCILLRDV
jgi:hypothetical protein